MGARVGAPEPSQPFAEGARAANTTHAYEADVAHFRAWARAHGATGLPATPETIALYVADLAAHAKPATIGRRLVAINVYQTSPPATTR